MNEFIDQLGLNRFTVLIFTYFFTKAVYELELSEVLKVIYNGKVFKRLKAIITIYNTVVYYALMYTMPSPH